MIDSHCHLTHARFASDVEGVVERARSAGLERCVTIGTGVDDEGAGSSRQRALHLGEELVEVFS